ncbi:uncharacterized protein LOC143028211 [Oratosquilla oratoria]|uniref:uncharacterized protein LOC143028211 n=1 Tax=Oratosquilla oratoria TaxID=337810 RepID=UPI003F75D4EC
MALGVVSNEGYVMSPHIFQQGLRANAAGYSEVLETVVKFWIGKIRDGRPYIFQQDAAPSHKAQSTQEWMSDNQYDHVTPNMRPPNSPDLNLMDYYVWSIIERDTIRYPHNNIVSLKTAIVEVMTEMNKNHLMQICQRFKSRIKAVTETEGGF